MKESVERDAESADPPTRRELLRGVAGCGLLLVVPLARPDEAWAGPIERGLDAVDYATPCIWAG
ncbi:MAG: hypothetical protein HQM01_10470 [Magnetococcales bacterium]|nr:hypothetical protein [Magnetococcales bacterium]